MATIRRLDGIGAGLALCGLGLLLMSGLGPASGWTHLIPGLIVAGVGSGLVNPALAATAVGVVPPRAAGMASGINTTFRQVGIATGIAVFGTLFATRITADIAGGLRGAPLAARAHGIAAAVGQDQGTRALAALPAAARQTAQAVTRSAFTAALNEILVVSGVGALLAAAAAAALIRRKDFVAHGRSQPQPAAASEPERAESGSAGGASRAPEPR
jgi:hypothetical protein